MLLFIHQTQAGVKQTSEESKATIKQVDASSLLSTNCI